MYRLGSSIPKERWFNCVDGTIITSIENLLENLQKLPSEQNKKIYEYHTKDHGNDFAKWIKFVYSEEQLSQAIEQTNTVEELKKTLEKFLQTCKEEGRIRNDENSFWLYYGVELNTLEDFIKELKKFGPQYHINTFNFHIKNNNNDFSNWLSECLNQKELAEKIRYCKTPQETLNAIEQIIAEENKSLKAEQPSEIKLDKKEAEPTKEEIIDEFTKPPKEEIEIKKPEQEIIKEKPEEKNEEIEYKEKILKKWKPFLHIKQYGFKQRFKELTTKYKPTNKQELQEAIQKEIENAIKQKTYYKTKPYGHTTVKIWEKKEKKEKELLKFIQEDEKIF
ncbi:DUF5752 family protein [Candidatus Woesearchaeota archaeon]|nr:DUF5752 family protein [Candidatus Woesearchaeota archaeon]MCF7900839.1 DUF5752 family protein [Candidatus Woesearchaeota archaeon]MCF8013839.1 DUF5752 family protein [Candidatus Woesearchaeota archaeon]